MAPGKPIALVGNSLAVMVAATSLARNGVAVTVVNGSKNWGGHFTTVSSSGGVFDPGMVLHEFTSFSQQDGIGKLHSYDTSVRSDVGRFSTVVRAYVEQYQATHTVSLPQMLVDGKTYDDILIANALSSLPLLPQAPQIEEQLLAIVAANSGQQLHASRKRAGTEFAEFTFEQASLRNHGATLHDLLIEPFCRKLVAAPSSAMLALYHRVLWLPLFYPETLLSYLSGRPHALPPTVFSYPTGGNVGDIAARLKEEIEQNSMIQLIHSWPDRIDRGEATEYELHFNSGAPLCVERLAWGNPLADLLRICGSNETRSTLEKGSIALGFVRIPSAALAREFSVLSIPDVGSATYRITNQTRCSAIESEVSNLVLESNPDFAYGDGDLARDLQARFRSDLVSLGIVDDNTQIQSLEVREMKNAFLKPTGSNREVYMSERNAVQGLVPDVALLGPASGFFSTSFNDQVVQGLQLAERWEN